MENSWNFINCKINLILYWSTRCFLIDNPIDSQEPTLAITDTKLYVLVVTLSTQDNAKLLEQLKSGFKRTIKWNEYESKVTVQQKNWYFDWLINPNFQGVNRRFLLSFDNTDGRTSYPRYYLPLVEIKNYNVVIDGRNLFNQAGKKHLIPYHKIWKIAIGQGDDYLTGFLEDYNYFNNHYKMIAIAIDLSKQQALDAGPKAIQQINFSTNLNKTVFLIIEDAKETILDFSQGTLKVLGASSQDLATACSTILFCFNIISI